MSVPLMIMMVQVKRIAKRSSNPKEEFVSNHQDFGSSGTSVTTMTSPMLNERSSSSSPLNVYIARYSLGVLYTGTALGRSGAKEGAAAMTIIVLNDDDYSPINIDIH